MIEEFFIRLFRLGVVIVCQVQLRNDAHRHLDWLQDALVNNRGRLVRLYSLYTQSHAVLKDEWFLKTLSDNFELVITKLPHEMQLYGTPGFNRLTWLKLDLLIDAVQKNWGKYFLYSDVDVQFFAPIEKALIEAIADRDLLVQRDSPQGHICNGFLFLHANVRTLSFLQSLKSICETFDGKYDDQDITNVELFKYALPKERRDQPGHELVNEAWYLSDLDLEKLCLLPNDYGLNWGYLPETFCSAGTISGEFWEPGKQIAIPHRPLIHHANWTVGIQNKIAQLEVVRKQVTEQARDNLYCQPLIITGSGVR